MIQLTRGGMLCSGSADRLQELQSEFAERHCIVLPQFLDPGLLTLIQRHLERAEFYELAHEDIRAESCMADNHLSGLLQLLTNTQELFHALERITGCGRIGQFQGRIYRMIPGGGHFDSWHTDLGPGLVRFLGLSVNLGAELFSGGVFQLRERGGGPIRCEVANTGRGDALLFRLAPNLSHRITPLEGAAAKIALAGWFHPQPPRHPLVRAGAQGSLAEFEEAGSVRQ
jgi:hypothetical protein